MDKETYDLLTERMEQEMVPFINQEGALEIPYLENMEIVGQSNNASAMMLPNLSRKESVNTSMVSKAQSSNVYQNGRGNSSGRRIVPPSANSVANAGHNPKRTVSANN